MSFKALDKLINTDISNGFPGAQLCVSLNGEIIKNEGYGHIILKNTQHDLNSNSNSDSDSDSDSDSYKNNLNKLESSINNETYFDIASLTKIFAIVYPFQCLIDKGLISLNQSLAEIFTQETLSTLHKADLIQEFKQKQDITISDLLSHQAGFYANPLYYDPAFCNHENIKHLDLYCQSRDKLLSKLLASPLQYKPRTQHSYADPDFMLLSFILEKISLKVLDHILTDCINSTNLDNLKLTFKPLEHNIEPQMIAATERYGNTRNHSINFPNIRTKMLHGTVQDEKAFHCMEQISGHAGLFANSLSLVRLLNLMSADSEFFSKDTKSLFLKPSPLDPTFGLGWRLNRAEHMNFTFGDYASNESFGHTAWTGCVLIHDPKIKLSIAYLTNRKNTDIINPKDNSNLFYGDQYASGKYKIILNLIYQGLGFA